MGSLSLIQEIFPTQGSNPGLPHCRQILYHLSYQGKPKNTGVGSLSLLQDLPDLGMNPALQVDSLPAELPGVELVIASGQFNALL